MSRPAESLTSRPRYRFAVVFGCTYVTPMALVFMAPFNHLIWYAIPFVAFVAMQAWYDGWLLVPEERLRHRWLGWYDRDYLGAFSDQAGLSASRVQVARAACIAVSCLGIIAWAISTWWWSPGL